MSSLDDVHTLPELLAYRAARTPQGEAYREYDAHHAHWHSLAWGDVQAHVQHWQRALSTSQLQAGQRVAILLPNGLQNMSIDQATLAQGAVPVPLHAIDNPGSIAYILADCEASLLVVAHLEQWQKIHAVGTPLPALHTVVVTGAARGELTRHQDVPGVRLVSLSDWLGRARRDLPDTPGPQPEDLATIVYTSGTTGKPKGVMLTHRNVLANVKAVLKCVQAREDDVFLSFLPLSHTFERTAGYYLPMAAGSCVVYARSIAQLGEDLRQVRPTVLVSVPRIYERIHAEIEEALANRPLSHALLEATQAVGWRRFRARQGLSRPPADDGQAAGAWRWLPWWLLRLLVARSLLAEFGGRVRVAVSGGAPLPPLIARCFLGLGLPLVQGYGMTETSPVVSVNTLDHNDPSTVGAPLPGVDVRIGDNRELQVHAESVMKGYWKRPEDTQRILSADGWLSTGDQAEIVGGRIRILGRIKEIIVTSTGEKVPPGDLEQAIGSDPLFEQVFVVGEQRPFIAAVAVVQREEWQRLAREAGVDPADAQSLKSPAVLRAALARIEKVTSSFPRYAVPRALTLTLEPWTIENTFMTPTLKLKRNNLMGHFAPEIEAMYAKVTR